MPNPSHIVRTVLYCVLALGSLGTDVCRFASAQKINPIVAVRGETAKHVWTLVNMSCGASRNEAVNPALPTIVITHGWNPAPNRISLTTPQEYARKIRARCPNGVNVLAFEWDSRNQGTPTANDRNAIRAGQNLGKELLARGADPATTHMIGHSMGTIVVASAAKLIHCETGQRIDKLTMIDGPKCKARVFIHGLDSPRCANQVVNFWAKGATGAGRPIDHPSVQNVCVPNRPTHRRSTHRRLKRQGHPCPAEYHSARINHIDIVIWYYQNEL